MQTINLLNKLKLNSCSRSIQLKIFIQSKILNKYLSDLQQLIKQRQYLLYDQLFSTMLIKILNFYGALLKSLQFLMLIEMITNLYISYCYFQLKKGYNKSRKLFYQMKKIQAKQKSTKSKIQAKNKSKNIVNNFLLTPRTAPVIQTKDYINKLDKFTQQIKSQRERKQQYPFSKGTPRIQHRVIKTDLPRSNAKKKIQDEETGTHTPLLKRVSFTSEMAKKKSTQSLVNYQRVKNKKKSSSKLSNSTSGEINKNTMQKLLSVIIKDYKEGKLKQNELQQTLLELFQRKQKKKSVGKNKKRKDSGFATFSNEFIKSSHRIRSEALMRKRKRSEQFQESVLERKGFVNKIIIKGITTSLFLKEDCQLTNIKDSDSKVQKKQPSFHINTSNSVKELCGQMEQIKGNLFIGFNKQAKLSRQQRMAIRIQRAWRKYQTRKILKQLSKTKRKEKKPSTPFHIIDEFTDSENDEAYSDLRFTRGLAHPNSKLKEQSRFSGLIEIISKSLKAKDLTKQQCLKQILKCINYPQDLIGEKQQSQKNSEQKSSIDHKSKEQSLQNSQSQNSDQQNYIGKNSRILLMNNKIDENTEQKQGLYEQISNQLNSFTNKYSSKEVNNQNRDFNIDIQNPSELDESLTFTHSQTGGNESFKAFNIKNIEDGLKNHEECLLKKKGSEVDVLTERFFANKITKEQYLKSKQKIEKWFKSKLKELKKIKNSLIKSCLDAKSIMQQQGTSLLNTEKSQKMLKCLSDKYIKKQDWRIKQDINRQTSQQNIEHLPCQQNQYEILRSTVIPDHIEEDQIQPYDSGQIELIFNNRKEQPSQEQEKNYVYEMSPKLARHLDPVATSNRDYKYEQIEKTIEQDDEVLEGLGKIQMRKTQSDKFVEYSSKQDNQLQAEQISLINNYVNQTNKKFKYLCTEDKQDIFEFLFLDLVLEMFTEYYSGQTKILKSAQAYINKAKRLKKIPKGIKTNLQSCKEYLHLLTQFVFKQPRALKNVSVPMGPTAFQMLRYMRDQIVQADDDQNLATTLVLPAQIFQKLGKTKELELKLQRYYDDQERELARVSFLKTAFHINNKSMFDSLNQMLDHQRPYGVWGKPFPWKKTLSLDKKWGQQQQKKKLKASVDKTLQCCSYLCGILVDKQQSLFGSHRVSQDYIMHIREDRLSKMLANDLIENEQRWIFYDDQQTQILMQVSAYVTKKIIKQLVLELVSIRMKH